MGSERPFYVRDSLLPIGFTCGNDDLSNQDSQSCTSLVFLKRFFKKRRRKNSPHTYLAIIWMHRAKHLCLPVDLKLTWICVMT